MQSIQFLYGIKCCQKYLAIAAAPCLNHLQLVDQASINHLLQLVYIERKVLK